MRQLRWPSEVFAWGDAFRLRSLRSERVGARRVSTRMPGGKGSCGQPPKGRIAPSLDRLHDQNVETWGANRHSVLRREGRHRNECQISRESCREESKTRTVTTSSARSPVTEPTEAVCHYKVERRLEREYETKNQLCRKVCPSSQLPNPPTQRVRDPGLRIGQASQQPGATP